MMGRGLLARLSFTAFAASILLPVTVVATTLRYVPATIDGERILVRDDRQPALYTADYGDCLGGNSLINVTRFEAAYYKDNMTVAFHLGGTTHLTNDDVMIYLGVYAYGEPRFQLTFNPCNANIWRYVKVVRRRRHSRSCTNDPRLRGRSHIEDLHQHYPD